MSDGWRELAVPRVTGTHADVLAAVGLADVLAEACNGPVLLLEGEAEFRVQTPSVVDAQALRSVAHRPGYPFLKARRGDVTPPGAQDVVDYEAERERVERVRQAGLGRRVQDAELRELVQQDQPRSDWRQLRILRALQGDDTANKVHEDIVAVDGTTFREALGRGLRAVAGGLPSGLRWRASLVQLFNPHAPKGYSRLKPDGTDRNDRTKDYWNDPFVEWLKYRGFFRVASGCFHGPERKHVRVLCPCPRRITVRNLEAVARELRDSVIMGGPPKYDALAVLRLAELLIRHAEDYRTGEDYLPGLRLDGLTPADVISGVYVTNYQSLGSARAVTEMHMLALPAWFPVRSREDASCWLAALDEHQRVLRALRDDRSDEIGLLLRYRRFLQTRGAACIGEFLEFLGAYGCFWLRTFGGTADGRKRWPPRFSASLVRRIIMESVPQYSAILEDPGFRAVAAAVRRCTVSAQALRAMNRDHREIRYELLHELRRNRNLPGSALLETVAEFVSLYNAENARLREIARDLHAAPANVTTEEFASFCRLLERYGAPVVGALLCAYGSCREAGAEPAEPAEAEEDREQDPTAHGEGAETENEE